ncbi:hypothetical protein TSMEX_009927 [Taenia solium]|eukprot:TsM_000302000 transcript=TsM_000302000 gene=TsM_000302000
MRTCSCCVTEEWSFSAPVTNNDLAGKEGSWHKCNGGSVGSAAVRPSIPVCMCLRPSIWTHDFYGLIWNTRTPTDWALQGQVPDLPLPSSAVCGVRSWDWCQSLDYCVPDRIPPHHLGSVSGMAELARSQQGRQMQNSVSLKDNHLIAFRDVLMTLLVWLSELHVIKER